MRIIISLIICFFTNTILFAYSSVGKISVASFCINPYATICAQTAQDIKEEKEFQKSLVVISQKSWKEVSDGHGLKKISIDDVARSGFGEEKLKKIFSEYYRSMERQTPAPIHKWSALRQSLLERCMAPFFLNYSAANMVG